MLSKLLGSFLFPFVGVHSGTRGKVIEEMIAFYIARIVSFFICRRAPIESFVFMIGRVLGEMISFGIVLCDAIPSETG